MEENADNALDITSITKESASPAALLPATTMEKNASPVKPDKFGTDPNVFPNQSTPLIPSTQLIQSTPTGRSSPAQEEPTGTNNNSDAFLAQPDVPVAQIATLAIPAVSVSSLKPETLSAKKSVVTV